MQEIQKYEQELRKQAMLEFEQNPPYANKLDKDTKKNQQDVEMS